MEQSSQPLIIIKLKKQSTLENVEDVGLEVLNIQFLFFF